MVGDRAGGDPIGDAVIDPEAESGSSGSEASARAEQQFYTDAGRQYALAHNGQNLGVLGKFFGSNATAPTNIAGLVVLTCLLFLGVTLFMPSSADVSDIRKLLLGTLSSSLAFIFGASSKK
jgi:hypothetical protein